MVLGKYKAAKLQMLAETILFYPQKYHTDLQASAIFFLIFQKKISKLNKFITYLCLIIESCYSRVFPWRWRNNFGREDR